MPSSSSFCYSLLFSLSFCKLSPLKLVVFLRLFFFLSSSLSLSKEEEEEDYKKSAYVTEEKSAQPYSLNFSGRKFLSPVPIERRVNVNDANFRARRKSYLTIRTQLYYLLLLVVVKVVRCVADSGIVPHTALLLSL
jgi:hypothetical protein